MISSEALPARAVQAFSVAKRFQKFLVVGSVGLLVNQMMLFALHDIGGMRLVLASPVAIFVSMVVTFMLNEAWTWHDRGSGPIVQRLGTYVPINTGGLIINWAILVYLAENQGVHHLVANLIGAGVAAVWNFGLNNAITWRE
jgi:putative flippase GtrA